LNNKIIKTLEEMAQEIFKEWILKNQKSKIKNQKLGNLADIKYGKEPSVNKLKKSGYSVYGANGIIGYSDYYHFSERQIIIGCRGVVGNVTLTLPNCVVTHNSLIIMPRNNNKIFFYYLLKNQNLDSVVGGSAQPQITIKDLEQLELPIIDENLQNKFESIAVDIEQKKLSSFYENQTLVALRDLLLPKLMSGEIKV
jgi:type I restriction enzyme S subunit